MLSFRGAPALSEFRLGKLERRLTDRLGRPVSVYAEFVHFADIEQTLDAAIAPLLRVVTSPEYEWRGDYCSLSSYAHEQLGMSASKARARSGS